MCEISNFDRFCSQNLQTLASSLDPTVGGGSVPKDPWTIAAISKFLAPVCTGWFGAILH